MRSLAIWILLFAALSGTSGGRDESLDELKARARTALPQDRPRLCVQIAELQLRNADRLYRDGDVELARAAVEDIVAYSELALAAASETKRHLKPVEIAVRKMALSLRDIRRTLAFEDQPAVEKAVQRLEEIRTSLLKQMFSKEKAKDKDKK